MRQASLRRDCPQNSLLPTDETHGDWFVLHTKSRQEKALSEDLKVRGVHHFLPLVRQSKFYGGRKAFVEVPLFAGYLFAKGDAEKTYAADRTGRVARIIQVVDQDRISWELRNLALALAQNPSLNQFAHLQAGVRVEVRAGPFQGVQGIVESRTAMDRLILQVTTLGRAVSLEVDASLLDII